MDKSREDLKNQFRGTHSLDYIYAESLNAELCIPQSLIQNILGVDGISVMYGDSNSGKTFFAIDMACAIARGSSFANKKTEQGIIVYLATESPGSIKMRLKAYHNYYNLLVPDFVIVQTPINFFNNNKDIHRIISLVHELEKTHSKKVKIIIGDTLARLSSGGNENSGEDMGVVMNRVDHIHRECNTHFTLIHHSGKNAAAGARGWSGIRAFIDTEIEITDTPLGKCAEITKQRDLNSKGERIGFRLHPLTIGIDKWGEPITSCVVQYIDAPNKESKPLSEVGGAIFEYLREQKRFISRPEIIKHFEGLYTRGAIYKQVDKLTENGKIMNDNGYFGLAKN
jgi:putative DNA primase/helicase